jgi:exopolyphosphatase/guanosine-5'-triphosphate,3'-diphosphate pyrophosphatase
MKVAVIDMGTNTFHLLLVETKEGDFNVIHRERVAVRVGEKGINKGMITEEAAQRALNTLQDFKEKIVAHGIKQVFATATSAIRSAANGQELVDKIKKQTGIQTRVISGLQEAEYIYYGVTKALRIGQDPGLIMDIGGGSIEFIIGTDKQLLWKQSFEIGGQRLMELFHMNDPIQQPEIDELCGYLEGKLQELFDACEQYRPKTLIGSSGTFDTLSDIYREAASIQLAGEHTELPLTMEALQTIHHDILSKTRAERLAIPGMIPLRVDMIVVAMVLIQYILKKCDLNEIRVSAYALKEGVLLNTIHSLPTDS